MMTWYEADTLEDWRERRRARLRRVLRNPFRARSRAETTAPAKLRARSGIASDA